MRENNFSKTWIRRRAEYRYYGRRCLGRWTDGRETDRTGDERRWWWARGKALVKLQLIGESNVYSTHDIEQQLVWGTLDPYLESGRNEPCMPNT